MISGPTELLFSGRERQALNTQHSAVATGKQVSLGCYDAQWWAATQGGASPWIESMAMMDDMLFSIKTVRKQWTLFFFFFFFKSYLIKCLGFLGSTGI